MAVPPPAAPSAFDYEAASERQVDFILHFFERSVGGSLPSTPAEVALWRDQFQAFIKDSASAMAELGRLYNQFESLQRKHMPHAGEPGAPTVCTGCSLHGAQVPWPCETYRFAEANIPGHR